MKRLAIVSWVMLLGLALVAPGQELKKPREGKQVFYEAFYYVSPQAPTIWNKIGPVKTTQTPFDQKTPAFVRTENELRLTVAREGQKNELKADVSSDETAKGDVVGLKARIWMGRDTIVEMNGVITDGKIALDIKSNDGSIAANKQNFNWNPACIGYGKERVLIQEKQPKVGDELKYRYFEAQLSNQIAVTMKVVKLESVSMPGNNVVELLRVEATPDPIKLPDGKFLNMPKAITWHHPKTFELVRRQQELPGVGPVISVITTERIALAPNGQVPDIMKLQAIKLKGVLKNLHELDRAKFVMAFDEKIQNQDIIAKDNRQTVEIDGKVLTLSLNAVRTPVKGAKANAVDKEFLAANPMLDSDHPKIQDLAKKAVGAKSDPLEKAKAIESFVRNYIKEANYSEAMLPATKVAELATGDCTEFSVLAAAMCRAQGVPSRTATGLVYVPRNQELAYHMWYEVYVDGTWVGLDATLAQGSIGAGHIKIADQSWANAQGFVPILPVMEFLMAKPKIEYIPGK